MTVSIKNYLFNNVLSFFFQQCTRVMWTPPLRESFSYPFLVFQLLAVTLTIKYVHAPKCLDVWRKSLSQINSNDNDENCCKHEWHSEVSFTTVALNASRHETAIVTTITIRIKLQQKEKWLFLIVCLFRSSNAGWRHLSLVALTTSLFMIPWQVFEINIILFFVCILIVLPENRVAFQSSSLRTCIFPWQLLVWH